MHRLPHGGIVSGTVLPTAMLAPFYDALSRQHWLRHRLLGAPLDMHKRLRPAEDLNLWLYGHLAPPRHALLLDPGCGFGATLLALAPRHPGPLVGITLSPFQARKARALAHKSRFADRLLILCQSFDDPFPRPPDHILAIETFFHARDLDATLAHCAAALPTGGRLILLEDMATDALENDPDGRALAALWHTATLHTSAAWDRALQAAGFAILSSWDLTDRVPRRPLSALARSARRNRRLHGLLPAAGVRAVLDAFLGGIHLERLYSHNRMRYRAVLAERTER